MSRVPVWALSSSVATVVLSALAAYLFIFYASAVDKAFFLNEDAIREQVEEGSYAGIRDIVNPKALFTALQDENQDSNYLVLFFPWIFLGFALAVDHFWEFGKIKWAIVLVVGTFFFDVLLAYHISEKIYLARKYIAIITGETIPEWALGDNVLNILTVIFCGFCHFTAGQRSL